MWRQLISGARIDDAAQRQRNPGLQNLKILLAQAMEEKSKQKAFGLEMAGKKELSTFEENLPSTMARTDYYKAGAEKLRGATGGIDGKGGNIGDLSYKDALNYAVRGLITERDLQKAFPSEAGNIPDDLSEAKESWKKEGFTATFEGTPEKDPGDGFPTTKGASRFNPLRNMFGWNTFNEPTKSFAQAITSRADLTDAMNSKIQIKAENPEVDVDSVLNFYKDNGLYYSAPEWFKDTVNQATQDVLNQLDTKEDITDLTTNIDYYKEEYPDADWDAIMNYYVKAGIISAK